MSEWTIIPEFPDFEINRRGEVRLKSTGAVVKHVFWKQKDTPCVYFGNTVLRQVNMLLYIVYGDGAAETAGLQEPMECAKGKFRNKSEGKTGHSVGGRLGDYAMKAHIQKTSKRRCATCGKATHNYRCERCWKKVRGFGYSEITESTVAGDRKVWGKTGGRRPGNGTA